MYMLNILQSLCAIFVQIVNMFYGWKYGQNNGLYSEYKVLIILTNQW
jgi:hypothetical protein